MAEIMCLLGLADCVVGTVTPEATMPENATDAYAQIPQLGDKKIIDIPCAEFMDASPRVFAWPRRSSTSCTRRPKGNPC